MTIQSIDLRDRVSVRLGEFFDQQIDAAASLDDEYRRLWVAAKATSEGGKRLRPTFVVAVYESFGGRDDEAALSVATAFEILHTAFLLHDDVIDGDLVRRGAPNLAGVFTDRAVKNGAGSGRAAIWGQAAAILAGDLLLHSAQRMIAVLSVAPELRCALLDLLDHCMFVTAAGELTDVALSLGMGEARFANVMAMSERKTAAYSFEGPLLAGAILAGASGECIRVLEQFGRLTGTAFQLTDDVLGVFGAEQLTGKSSVNDLREGKETLLIAYARSTTAWRTICRTFGKPRLTEADAHLLRRQLEDCGAREFVEGVIADLTARATRLIIGSDLPVSLQQVLSDLGRTCAERIA